jgi:hypothetical protein
LTDARLWMDAWNLSGDLNKIALQYGAELQDATTFLNAARARRAGLKDVALALEGFWNGGVDQVDEVLFNRIGVADVPVTVVPSAGAVGDIGFSFRAALGQYAPGASVGEMFKFSVDAEGSADLLFRGHLLHNGSQSGNGNGTAVNEGAVGASQKLYAVLHVLDVTGGGTWTIKVQSDDAQGFASAIDRITFAAVTAKGSQWATPLAGAISDTWWRVNFAVAGGSGNNITFVVLIGIQ